MNTLGRQQASHRSRQQYEGEGELFTVKTVSFGFPALFRHFDFAELVDARLGGRPVEGHGSHERVRFLFERDEIGLRRSPELLRHHPLVGASEPKQPGYHGVEFCHGHGVLEEKVRDYEREGAWGREDVQDGHESRDVTDDPSR